MSKVLNKKNKAHKKLTTREPKLNLLLQFFRFGFNNLGPIFPSFAGDIAFKLFATPRNKKSSSKPSAIMDDAHTYTVTHKKRRIQCYAWGKTGPKVLLAHGWESKGAHLQNFVPPLLEMGYQVLTYDAPAHGNSTGKTSHLLDFGEVIAAVANQFGGVEHIIAHSMGSGASVFALAEENLKLEVKKLVMITSPNRMQDVLADFYKILQVPTIVQNYFEAKVEKITGRSVEYFQIADRLKEAKAEEFLLIHDEDDDIIPLSYGEKIAAKNPKLQLLVTKGKGHYRIIKDREVIEIVVDFLKG